MTGDKHTGDEGFGRERRLTRARDYSQVFADNFRCGDRQFTLLVRQRDDEGSARLGLAVAKKQIRRAVDRNRLKRIIRESFRRNRSSLPPVDIVVMVRRPVLELEQAEIFSRLQRLWHKIIERCENS